MNTEHFKKIIAVTLIVVTTLLAISCPIESEAKTDLQPNQINFIETYRDLAKQYEEKEQINYKVTLAYSALESGWGAGEGWQHNLFGMHNKAGKKANHGSRENSYRLFFQNLHDHPEFYGDVWNYSVEDGYSQLVAIKQAYNTENPEYLAVITGIYNKISAYEAERDAELAKETERQAEIDAAVEEAVTEAKAAETERVLSTVEGQIYQQEYQRASASAHCLAGINLHIASMFTATVQTASIMEDMRYAVAAGNTDVEAVTASVEENGVIATAAAPAQ